MSRVFNIQWPSSAAVSLPWGGQLQQKLDLPFISTTLAEPEHDYENGVSRAEILIFIDAAGSLHISKATIYIYKGGCSSSTPSPSSWSLFLGRLNGVCAKLAAEEVGIWGYIRRPGKLERIPSWRAETSFASSTPKILNEKGKIHSTQHSPTRGEGSQFKAQA
ncbi:unnamed protein product [Cyclocybe aegerita]|uniref:Uncharacterized protein n=1 Tax=Cyclocybe aegerita TaxID=1973307 RepID=A0A8S0VRX0_CYCAE|nr:unnamed protein product [Cyclocybe aegerita]